MYHFINGRIVSMEDNLVVLENNDIGYELTMSSSSIAELGGIRETVKIFTYLNVREDEMSLFGFANQQEKNFFLKLITISGIGPKVAIGILSYYKLSDLLTAIVTGNIGALSKIKGVGKKTAERIVLELKDRISKEFDVKMLDLNPIPDIITDDDAVEALMSLGYTKAEAVTSVSKVYRDGMSTEQTIMLALKG